MLGTFTHAQELLRYSFTHYTTQSGLISYQVNSVVQDDEGYIWIATNDGLQRHDGIRYKNFTHRENDSSSLPSKAIWQVTMDAQKNLWILTIDGEAGIFDRQRFKFLPAKVRIKNEAQLRATQQLKRLITDQYNNIFLLLPGYELATYSKEKNEFSSMHNFNAEQADWKIMDFVQEPGTKKYWMCIKDMGLAVYNAATHNLSYKGANTENEALINKYKDAPIPTKLYFDKKGTAWFVTAMGSARYLYHYKKSDSNKIDKFQFDNVISNFHEVRHFLEQKDGTLWITGVKIFARFDEKENVFHHVFNGYENEHSIDYITISCLYEDKENNLWTGTANNGIFRFNPSEEFFQNIPHYNPITKVRGDGAPLSFAMDKDGSILCGVWGEGLFRYDKNFRQIPLGIKGLQEANTPPIWTMLKSSDSNTIWMGAEKGIYKYNQQNRTVTFFNPAAFEGKTVRVIAEDKNGFLWIGMQGIGVFKWDPVKGKNNFDSGLKKITSIPNVQINKITAGNQQFIWIACFSQGVYAIDPVTENTMLHFDNKAAGELRLPDQTATAAFEYNDTLALIATSSHLLTYNKVQRKLSLITNEALAGFTSAMEKDNRGHVWLSTTAGIYRISIANHVLVKFNREDGITNDFFVMGAASFLPGNKMFFGASARMVIFNPSKININKHPPLIRLTDFKVVNQYLRVDSLLQQKIIELPADENSITLDFSTLSFNSNYLLKYKLDGLDKDWKIAGKDQQLVYNYLPAGQYTLMVTAIDAEGNSSDKVFLLMVTIKPPYWRSWWFYGLLVLLAAMILYWYDKDRMSRKEAMLKMRTDIAGSLHAEVNSALGNINVLSEMARLKASKEPEKSIEFIEQIRNKSKNMINAMDDMLWSINPENDSMFKTLERMKEYVALLNTGEDVEIELVVDQTVEKMELNMKLRHESFLLFKEGIKSIIQTGCKKCQLFIGSEKGNLIFTMQLDNRQCDLQLLNNALQRLDLQKRIKTINATASMDVQKSFSIFTLEVLAV